MGVPDAQPRRAQAGRAIQVPAEQLVEAGGGHARTLPAARSATLRRCRPARLIYADSIRDPDLYLATGIAVVDPFTYVETDGKRVIVTSELEADAARRNSSATEVWTGSEFGARELIKGGMELRRGRRSRSSAARWRSSSVTEVAVPPSFPVELADYLRGHGITVQRRPRRATRCAGG